MGLIDRTKNKAEMAKGKGKRGAASITGHDSLAAEGRRDEGKGRLKDAGEDLKDAADKVKNAVQR